ncbi:MAG: hypothetical protein LBT00_08320 [Spirochaetaceae bacterium]|nr:hypothetical protein [Spirochaetaceae bacterium]
MPLVKQSRRGGLPTSATRSVEPIASLGNVPLARNDGRGRELFSGRLAVG